MHALDIEHLRAKLADNALSVCHYYLSNGRKVGNYWIVGDVHNTPGRSLFLRLCPDTRGAKAGRWSDAATGEYGDLLDLIGLRQGLIPFRAIVAEAERFLGLTSPTPLTTVTTRRTTPQDPVRVAKRLYDTAAPLASTLAESYLRHRGLNPACAKTLKFLPHCYCRPTAPDSVRYWPALLAPVTDLTGQLTGVHRLYLDPAGYAEATKGKAPIPDPKRSLGSITTGAVRFGPPSDTVVVGEGIESVLSIRTAIPTLTAHAALSAGNLADYALPPAVRRLLIAGDADKAGRLAVERLAHRARAAGLQVSCLWPMAIDHNADLCAFGAPFVRENILAQIAPPRS